MRNGRQSKTAVGALADFHWLVSLIRRLRPDLCKLFRCRSSISLEFARWLAYAGRGEYRALRQCPEYARLFDSTLGIFNISPLEALIYLERADVRAAYPLPEKREDYRRWFYLHGVDEHNLFETLGEEGKRRYWAAHGQKARIETVLEPATQVASPQFGVNLVGYAYGELGIGEDLRMTARALQAAGVPFGIINFPPGKEIPQNEMSMARHVGADAPYGINIFCLTALETGRYFAEQGADLFKCRFNIGYWPWELARWPQEWRDLTKLVDEVWVSSRHIYDALAPVCDKPVLIMPLAVDCSGVSGLGRSDYGLPADDYLFCFSFDLNSSIWRKNPGACLAAFQTAFPKGALPCGRRPGLVIKCHKPARANADWDALKKAAQGDARIHIVEQTLTRPDLLALYRACDCYVSLHRAEGYGRGLAEALLLGLEVIATGYSGNVDFCRAAEGAHLARYKLIPVRAGQYPYGGGQSWAQADIGHAAELMRQCAASGKKGHAGDDFEFTLANAGKRYARRLRLLWQSGTTA